MLGTYLSTYLSIMLVANGEDAAARPYLERAAALGCADAHFVLQGIEAPRPDGSVPVDDVR